MSASAFSTFSRYAQTHDMSDVSSSRWGLQQCRDAAFPDTPYGPVIVSLTVHGVVPAPNRELCVANPIALVHVACKGGGAFKGLIDATMMPNPCTLPKPWSLVVYGDEVVPGNVLNQRNFRKIWAVYWSLLEFGLHLSDETAWFPCVAEASQGLKKVNGGISQVMAAVLKLCFGSHTFDFRTGIQLQGPDGSRVRVYITLSMMVQDGAAHKLIWQCKGDAGSRLCILCRNLVSRSSGLVDEDGSDLLVCSTINAQDLDLATDDDIRGSINRLKAYKLTDNNATFKLRQQAVGFTYCEHGLLFDSALDDIVKPASQYCHDWMHGLLSNGVFSIVVFWCLMRIEASWAGAGTVWSTLDNYLKTWHWPKHVKYDVERHSPFDPANVKSYKKHKAIKIGASDALSLLPVLVFWLILAVLPTGTCIPQCRAVIALSDLIEALQSVTLGLTSPERLQAVVDALLKACEDAGWHDYLIPKFHWCCHFSGHLRRWAAALSCFTQERKHKGVKRYADAILNHHVYNRSVLSEIIAHQLAILRQDGALDLTPGLRDPGAASRAIADFLRSEFGNVAAHAQILHSSSGRLASQETVTKSDAVLIRSEDGENFVCGQVWFLAEIKGIRTCALVSFWEFESYDQPSGSAIWRIVDRPSLIDFNLMLCPVIWSDMSRNRARTLIPFAFRGFQPVAA